MHFDANSQLCKLIDRLQKTVIADGLGQFASLLDVSSVYVYIIVSLYLSSIVSEGLHTRGCVMCQFEIQLCDRYHSRSNNGHRTILQRVSHISNGNYFVVLRYAMLIDLSHLFDAQFNEYKQYACSGSLMTSPILERSISVFNVSIRYARSQFVSLVVSSRCRHAERERASLGIIYVIVR